MANITAARILTHAFDTGDHELAALTIATGALSYLRLLQEQDAALSLPELLGKLSKFVTANVPAPRLAPATTQG